MASDVREVLGSVIAAGRNGAVSGAAGLLAMDLVWYRRYRTGGGSAPFFTWEFLSSPRAFADAPAPARVGQALAERANVRIPDRLAGVTNNVVHWSTGITWGVLAGLLRLVPGIGWLKGGLIAGVTAWATSYAVLPKLKVYKPISEYDTKTLWKDLSAHLVFGSVAGASSAALGVAARK